MRIAALSRLSLAPVIALALAAPLRAQVPPSPSTDITVTGQKAPFSVAPLVGGSEFVSPMGEPFRSRDALSGAEHWFEGADANHDGRLTRAEFLNDADRFFAFVDTDHDGEIGPDEIEHYESEIAPEIRVLSTYGDPELAKTDDDGNVTPPPYPTRLGAGRYGYLDSPEPIVSADTNFDRAIARQEFLITADRRFKQLDTNGDGAITRDELPKLSAVKREEGGARKPHFEHGGGHHGGGGGMGGGGYGGPGG